MLKNFVLQIVFDSSGHHDDGLTHKEQKHATQKSGQKNKDSQNDDAGGKKVIRPNLKFKSFEGLKDPKASLQNVKSISNKYSRDDCEEICNYDENNTEN